LRNLIANTSKLYPKKFETPVIVYWEINPTKYVIYVRNASKPFFLVFSETYHKDWVIYIDGQSIPEVYHFIANGYANVWYINKLGDYIITLEFWPQRLFYIGVIISLITLSASLIFLLKNILRKL
jgi:hypothetical protein